jgi:ubiquinone/menaquinone biosynthesis C-methylase UbiE
LDAEAHPICRSLRGGGAVAEVDASKSAIATAHARFAVEKLTRGLQVADFTALPFADASFDLVVDRAGLTCAGFSDARKAIQEIHRVTRIGGRFCFNPYSDHHGSRSSGYIDANGLTQGIGAGSLTRVRQICFYGRSQVESLLKNYRILSLQHIVATDMLKPDHEFHAEWRVIAERIA